MSVTVEVPAKPARKFLNPDFVVTTWKNLEPYYQSLLDEEISSVSELESWLKKLSELESVVHEDLAWRYIKMTCNTKDKQIADSYKFFIEEIMPNLAEFENKIQKKFYHSPFMGKLDQQKYKTLIRNIKQSIELFREENIPLQTKIQTLTQEYDTIMSSMSIEEDGKQLTLQQAGALLEKHDRQLREKIWRKVSERRLSHKEQLNDLFDKLIKLRSEVAKNAGYKSYTEYKFDELGRFDYTQNDCDQFHNAIEKVIKPIHLQFLKERKEKLGLDSLKPWDLSVDIHGSEPLKPFHTSDEMVDKTIQVLSQLDDSLGSKIAVMKQIKHLDLDSRIGKAPGGYNYPLAESGIPFIFMNAVGTQGDLTTMLHEEGHAIHSFLTRELELNEFKQTPSEVAELASMSMELITLDFWDVFYKNKEELKRAKREQISRTLSLLPWVATVDAYQKWVYQNPDHSHTQRKEEWTKIYKRFHGETEIWDGFENELGFLWQKQGHIFDVPFYYIEYGMAQLGAIAVWRNYKLNAEKGLQGYLNALKLGYTRTIPEIYEAAGIKFEFTESYIRELADFVQGELKRLDE